MARCQAGNCEVECEGKGCGCIAISDSPDDCNCFCFGGGATGGLTLKPATLIDVSINDLPLFEAATFLNKNHTERIVVRAGRLSDQVFLSVKRKPFAVVLKQLGLTTVEGIERGNRRKALPIFLAGFAVGALLFTLRLQLR